MTSTMTGSAEPAAPSRPLPAPVAMLIGVLGIFTAVAVGHLVAGFVGGNASPFRAVANEVRDNSPSAVVEWAKSTLGHNDKLVAQVSVAVALVLLGMIAGLLSRRAAWPGIVIAIGLGLLGIAAVLDQHDLGQLAIIAPVFSLVAGAGTFGWLHGLATARTAAAATESAAGDAAEPTESEPTESGTDDREQTRRRFMIVSGGTALGAGVLLGAGEWLIDRVDVEGSRAAVGPLRPAVPEPAVPPGADFASIGTPTYLTSNEDFYRIDTAFNVPRVRTQDWRLRIHGMVDKEISIGYDDLRRHRLVERDITLTCVSNPVGGNLISNARFVGVPIHELLDEAGVQAGAEQVFSTSKDGWSASTPVDALQDPKRMALLAIGMNGEPLPVEHGFPVRMVVPGLYGFVSATKWVVDMEVTKFSARTAYWTDRGWSEQGPIKTESRIDVPNGTGTVKAGKVTFAGLAWAQNTGIDRVELRVNNEPWQQAQLSTEVTNQAWRMWRLQVDLAPGSYTAQCRATDRSGYTQTEQRVDVIPDGATGLHTIQFDVG